MKITVLLSSKIKYLIPGLAIFATRPRKLHMVVLLNRPKFLTVTRASQKTLVSRQTDLVRYLNVLFQKEESPSFVGEIRILEKMMGVTNIKLQMMNGSTQEHCLGTDHLVGTEALSLGVL